MINVIMHESFLCCTHCFFNSMQLLCYFKARTIGLYHSDNGPQMPLCTLESLDNIRV